MNFDTLILAAVASELQTLVLGARVEKISQPAALEVIVHLYHTGRKRALLISLEPTVARVHLTTTPRSNPPAAPGFCMLLRKYLEGGWLEGIEHPFGLGERVLKLTFLGLESRRFCLFVELMGKHSNLILTDDERNILGAIKTVRSDMSRFREIRTGLKYFAPPKLRAGKRDAFAPEAGHDLPAVAFDATDAAEKWLQETFTGLSVFMAHEAVSRSTPPLTSESVWFGLNDLLNSARLAEYSPVEFRTADDPLWQVYPVMLKSVPAIQQRPANYVSEALDKYFDSFDLRDSFDRERDALLSALRRSIKSCEREIIDVAEGLVNADRAEEYRQMGDLILANANQIKSGARTAIVPDYYNEQGSNERTIDLDPKMSVQENASRYYKKHQKARDAHERLGERQHVLESTLTELVEVRELVTDAVNIHDLQQIAEGLGEDVSSHLRPGRSASAVLPQQPDEGPKYEGHKIKRYHSIDGWEVLVGENATSNDYLTTRIAAPNDIWMHARAITSAHAIIRSQNRPASVSTAAIRLAAEQVARRSDAKHAHLVPVDYTLKKFVRKPRGAAPGAVTYSHEKTLDVVPDGE